MLSRATERAEDAIVREAGCSQRGCQVQVMIDPAWIDARHPGLPVYVTHDSEHQSFSISVADAAGQTLAEQITAWLRAQHGEAAVDGD